MKRNEKLVIVTAAFLMIWCIIIGFQVYAAETVEVGIAPPWDDERMVKGSSGQWCYSACAPEYEVIFDSMTDEDWEYLRRCVYRESARRVKDDATRIGMESTSLAVCETIFNRVLDPKWPDTVKGVITDTRYGKQFCYAEFNGPYNGYENWYQYQHMVDVMNHFYHYDCDTCYLYLNKQLPSNNYQFFATSKQSIATNHIWIGMTMPDGSPRKPFGMYFGEKK